MAVSRIKNTIAKGVAAPKASIGGMPPLAVAPLQAADVDAVSAYVWAISHRK
jgi:hypothetical protein